MVCKGAHGHQAGGPARISGRLQAKTLADRPAPPALPEAAEADTGCEQPAATSASGAAARWQYPPVQRESGIVITGFEGCEQAFDAHKPSTMSPAYTPMAHQACHSGKVGTQSTCALGCRCDACGPILQPPISCRPASI